MKNKINAYEYFKEFDYNKYFKTHLGYILNPLVHMNDRLSNSSTNELENSNKQRTLNVMPRYLLNRIDTEIPKMRKDSQDRNNNQSLNYHLSVLDSNLLKRIQ